MNDLLTRDVEYEHDGTRMVGALCAVPGARNAPGVLLIHDAFGLSEEMFAVARRIGRLGFAVFAADVWGDRTQPATEAEIRPLLGSMVGDRRRWMGRVAAAHAAATAQPEVDGSALAVLGYCFGGSSALEYLRTGGDVRGVVSIHGGLDLLDAEGDWSVARSGVRVLLCTGADDPMATATQRVALETAMSRFGVDWEADLYSGTKHAFTSPKAKNSPNPDVVAYHPRSAARAWEATARFLREQFPQAAPVEDQAVPDRLDRR
ncbi:dienelactone hydrolase family protein [Promicromonospora sp. NFX87]|uniref:dienelactone hydrolase family protein n=1 Tax=Promicromonospora sp. NFX87 TaxID=3402691 RepID=UPI003AFA9CC3